MAVKVEVTYHGFFFTGNPVGQMRQNLYRDVLPEVASRQAVQRLSRVGSHVSEIAAKLVKGLM